MPTLQQLENIGGYGSNRWSIDGVLSGLTLLWGDSGIGKSFVAISMASSVSMGVPWMGRRVKEGAVYYIAGEGGASNVAYRMRTALKERHVDMNDERVKVPLFVITPGIDFVDHASEFVDLIGEEPYLSPQLIVVDTLARCFLGDENKQEYMGKFVKSLDLLREHYECDILVVHHANKIGKVRGSSVLFGAVDVSWHLTNAKGRPAADGIRNMVLKADKLRERCAEEAQIHLRAVPVPIVNEHDMKVLDEFGDEQTTILIKPSKQDIERVTTLSKVGRNKVDNGGNIKYSEWRESYGCKTFTKSQFDAALSFILTSPGRWGVMRGYKPGVFTKAVQGVEEDEW